MNRLTPTHGFKQFRHAPDARARSGYVLLLTLVVILLAALLTAGMARQSLRLALESASAQTELQDRWGRWSIERTVLPMSASAQAFLPKSARQRTLQLGEQSFAIELSEENAKLNLNALLREHGRAEVEQALRRLAPTELPRRLRPLNATRDAASNESLDSWGQVFDFSALDGRTSAAAVQRATRRLTLWGDGRLNIASAERESIRTLCEGVVADQVLTEMLRLNSAHPDEELRDLLGHLALRHEDQEALSRLLTTRSTCFGLWVSSDRGSEFCAWDRSNPRRARLYRYRW